MFKFLSSGPPHDPLASPTPTGDTEIKCFLVLTFALPALLLLWGLDTKLTWPWVLAAIVQAPGLLAERWFFFAQAKHPQNLYYQVVS